MLGPLMLAILMAGQQNPPVKQEIVVTAQREEQPRDQAAAAVTLLDRQAVEQLPATSLAEVLAAIPGVTMFFDGGAAGRPWITSRGFFGGGEVEYVKLIVDGIPVGDAESGNVDWQRFRTADVDRIEVLHGPGSAMYGDAALGGVIQVFTRHPEDGLDARLGAGSFGSQEARMSVGRHLGAAVALRAIIGGWTTGGFRQHANAADRLALLSADHVASRSAWRVDVEADREHRKEPGALTEAQIADDRTQSNPLFRLDRQATTRTRIGMRYDSFGTVPLHAVMYAMSRGDETTRTVLLAPEFGASAFRSLTTRAGGGTFEASRETSRVTWRAGTDLERATLSGRYSSVDASGHASGTVAAERGSRDRIGLFVTGGWAAADRVFLSAGIRRDEIRDDVARRETSSAWSPRAGVNVHLGSPAAPPLVLFVQIARAFKAPTLDQLFDPRPYPDGGGGTFTISNPALRPQRANNIEAGLSRTTAWSDWSVVGYRMKVRDEIDFDPQTFSYDNIGSSLHRGVEASFAVERNARVWPQVTYAWTRVADTATPHLQLKNIPQRVAQLLLHARLGSNTRADALYRWRGRVALDDADVFRTPAVSRLDLRLSHDAGAFRIEADLRNALNARYDELGYVMYDFRGRPTRYEYPAPGREVRVGIVYRAPQHH